MKRLRFDGGPRLRPRARLAFALTDLLVLMGLAVLAMPFIIGCMRKARDPSYRLQCASNLRQIGQAMQLYANENNGIFPRTRYDANQPVYGAAADVTDQAAVADPFKASYVNNVPSELWLLLRTQDLVSAVFVCPNSGTEVADAYQANKNGPADAQHQSNFTSVNNLSYSIQCAYGPDHWTGADEKKPKWARWNIADWTADMALAADINPGAAASSGSNPLAVRTTSAAKDQQLGNSPNHQKQGQNVLFGDGHVDWNQNQFCGANNDPIYVANPSRNGGGEEPDFTGAGWVADGKTPPLWQRDSVLYPVAK